MLWTRKGRSKLFHPGDINARTPKYTFSHPTGLLFTTQFAQIALVVKEKAAFENASYKMSVFLQAIHSDTPLLLLLQKSFPSPRL
jgi:hypothetical protein